MYTITELSFKLFESKTNLNTEFSTKDQTNAENSFCDFFNFYVFSNYHIYNISKLSLNIKKVFNYI